MDLTNITEEIIELYHDMPSEPIYSDKKEIISILSNLLTEAIEKRAKGKIGVAFSGGVDSTLIAFILHKLKKEFILYNVGLENSQDLEWAKKISKKYNWNLKQIIFSIEEAESIIKKVVSILPDPSVVKVGVACPEFVVLEEAKKDGCDLVFGGLGSEEIFAGYERHKQSTNVHEECWVGLKGIYNKDLERDLAISNSIGMPMVCPFLDKDVIKYSMLIVPELKINQEYKKIILRETADHLGLDHEFSFRPKKAAQYGSGFDKAIDKLGRRKGFKFKKDYLKSLR